MQLAGVTRNFQQSLGKIKIRDTNGRVFTHAQFWKRNILSYINCLGDKAYWISRSAGFGRDFALRFRAHATQEEELGYEYTLKSIFLNLWNSLKLSEQLDWSTAYDVVEAEQYLRITLKGMREDYRDIFELPRPHLYFAEIRFQRISTAFSKLPKPKLYCACEIASREKILSIKKKKEKRK